MRPRNCARVAAGLVLRVGRSLIPPIGRSLVLRVGRSLVLCVGRSLVLPIGLSLVLPIGLSLVLLAAARPVHAATGEWSTMSVSVEEEDDENFLDHYLSRPVVQWRDEWEGAHGGLRVNQGCLTSGIWYQVTW